MKKDIERLTSLSHQGQAPRLIDFPEITPKHTRRRLGATRMMLENGLEREVGPDEEAGGGARDELALVRLAPCRFLVRPW